MGWTLLLTFPLMCAIQQVSAKIGRAAGAASAAISCANYPRWLVYFRLDFCLPPMRSILARIWEQWELCSSF